MSDRSKSTPAPDEPPAATGADEAAAVAREPAGDRVAKVIARAGLCSRRDAERMILAGRVAVNGRVIDSPALNVVDGDIVSVDGKPLGEPERVRVWRYHKPSGLMTTHRDPEGRPTVFEHLPEHLPRVISVGRLDMTSEGLLLLTNDGELARRLELPTTAWTRRYRVRAFGKIDQAKLDGLLHGITIDGVRYGRIEAKLEREQGDNCWLTMVLREGKNREIRKVLEHLGLVVNRLIRVSYGPFQLGELERGKVEEIPGKVLRDQLGERLSEGLAGLKPGRRGHGAPSAGELEVSASSVGMTVPSRRPNPSGGPRRSKPAPDISASGKPAAKGGVGRRPRPDRLGEAKARTGHSALKEGAPSRRPMTTGNEPPLRPSRPDALRPERGAPGGAETRSARPDAGAGRLGNSTRSDRRTSAAKPADRPSRATGRPPSRPERQGAPSPGGGPAHGPRGRRPDGDGPRSGGGAPGSKRSGHAHRRR